MISYERVKFGNWNSSRTVFLRVTRESARFLTGIEVDKEGEEVAVLGADQRMHVIDKDAISWRKKYEMDRTYGTLVPVSKRRR